MGFFTRSDAKKARTVGDTPIELLHQLGVDGVADMNRLAKHPNMLPTGDSKPDIYILGEAPGEYEDEKGEQFVGKSGKLIRAVVDRYDNVRVMWDNCCRTRPPQNRTPNARELECFRPSVVASIQDAKPKIIIGAGNTPLQWMLPGLSSGIKVARGRRFPVRVGRHACWFYPTLHPAFVLRIEGGREDDIPGEEWRRFFDRDVAAAFDDLADLPPPCIESTEEAHVMGGVELLTDPSDILAVLRSAPLGGLLALDIETNCLRPYAKGSRWLSAAIATESETYAFPICFKGHDMAGAFSEILAAFVDVLVDADGIIAHNLSFELEWLATKLYPELAYLVRWHDTRVQAYVIDHRDGGQSLDYCCRQQLGFPIKSLSDLPRDGLADCALEDVLRYNAIDAKYTHRLFTAQDCIIADLGLGSVYDLQMERVPTLVLTQVRGIDIDQEAVEALHEKHEKRLREIEEEVGASDAVAEYNDRFGKFSLDSAQDVIALFRDVLRRPEGKRGKGYSCKKEVLEQMEDEPLAALVQEHRRLTKLQGTYVERFFVEHPESYIHPDGKVHCQFNHTRTATGRTSSSDPNNQNWPKRTDKSVRRMVVASPGHKIVACDYGQIEARVLAMASQDERFCDAIWNELDLHMEWAEKIVARDDRSFRARGGDMRAFRSSVKNEWTFPLFYGAGVKKVARLLDIHRSIAEELANEFKEEFSGVFAWQVKQQELYAREGWVECLTGRRRHGPLSYNMVINTPIQGSASDITVQSMNRISRLSIEQDLPWLHPALNVHDDITLVVPNEHLEDAIERVVEIMVLPEFEWINVPVSVEVEVGDNWAEMTPVGEFSTKDFL